jgi:hypothetical protein
MSTEQNVSTIEAFVASTDTSAMSIGQIATTLETFVASSHTIDLSNLPDYEDAYPERTQKRQKLDVATEQAPNEEPPTEMPAIPFVSASDLLVVPETPPRPSNSEPVAPGAPPRRRKTKEQKKKNKITQPAARKSLSFSFPAPVGKKELSEEEFNDIDCKCSVL